jgi:FHA domain
MSTPQEPTYGTEVVVPAERPSLETCAACGASRAGGDRFCEHCGYDFVRQTGGAQPAAPRWEAVVEPDRAYFEHMGAEDLTFPTIETRRVFRLDAPTISIGRRSTSRGVSPTIDLSDAEVDPGISHLHACLVRSPDGSYSLVDPGSTNGTTVNESTTPIDHNVPVALADGDRIHLGAWTTITVRRAGAPTADDGHLNPAEG